jgi:hypothetical protein
LIAAGTILAASCGFAGQVAADEDSSAHRVRAKAQALSGLGSRDSGPIAEAVVSSPYSASDAQDGPSTVDILSHTVKHTPTKVKLDLRVRRGTNPFLDETWVLGLSGPSWLISTNGDNRDEYFAYFINDGAGTLVGLVFGDPNAPAVCTAKPKFHDGNGYGLKFPRLCLGSPPTIRVSAGMDYDKPPYGNLGPEDPFDFTRYTPEVAAA